MQADVSVLVLVENGEAHESWPGLGRSSLRLPCAKLDPFCWQANQAKVAKHFWISFLHDAWRGFSSSSNCIHRPLPDSFRRAQHWKHTWYCIVGCSFKCDCADQIGELTSAPWQYVAWLSGMAHVRHDPSHSRVLPYGARNADLHYRFTIPYGRLLSLIVLQPKCPHLKHWESAC